MLDNKKTGDEQKVTLSWHEKGKKKKIERNYRMHTIDRSACKDCKSLIHRDKYRYCSGGAFYVNLEYVCDVFEPKYKPKPKPSIKEVLEKSKTKPNPREWYLSQLLMGNYHA